MRGRTALEFHLGGAVPGSRTILETLADDPEYSLFVEAVEIAGVESALEGSRRTVFAPGNGAMTQLLDDLGLASLDELSASQLRPIVLYHVVGSVLSFAEARAQALGGGQVTSLGGGVDLGLSGDELEVDRATVIEADIEAENGIIHRLDRVLLPSITDIVTTDTRLSGLTAWIVSARRDERDVAEACGPPRRRCGAGGLRGQPVDAVCPDQCGGFGARDAPGGQALTNMLSYHTVSRLTPIYASEALGADNVALETSFASHNIVVNGGTSVLVQDENVASDDAAVTTADSYAENGVLHLIDEVLLPSASL